MVIPTRKAAAIQLRRAWPPAAKFSADAPPERRQEQLAEIRQAWSKDYPLLDPTIAAVRVPENAPVMREPLKAELDQAERWVLELSGDRADAARASLTGLGPELLPVLETLASDRALPLPQAVYRDLLRKQAPEFEALDGLDSTSVDERRCAASHLARLAAEAPLRPLASCGSANWAARSPMRWSAAR